MYPTVEVPFREYGCFAVKSDPSRLTLEEAELRKRLDKANSDLDLAMVELQLLRRKFEALADSFLATAELATELSPGPLFEKGEIEKLVENPPKLTDTEQGRDDVTASNNATNAASDVDTVSAGDYGIATVGEGGAASAGNNGRASAGNYGTASAGNYGRASAGFLGTATVGYQGTATAGKGGSAYAGNRGTAIAGNRGTAIAGNHGSASAGREGMIQINYWDDRAKRMRTLVGYVGEDGIEPNVTYKVKDGKFV